jgi:hypothetical protein
MMRERSVLSAVVFFLLTAPLVFSQDRQSQPSPALPSEILGPQLIVWSQAQKPQPVPQPLPPPERPVQQQPDQPGAQPASPPAPSSQKPAQQTFTGTIVKDGSRYVLKVAADNVYQIDDQDAVKQYEGKPVKIVGNLNADGHSIRVVKIELMS